MAGLRVVVSRVGRALQRARWPIATVALTYGLSLMAGILMIHADNALAVSQRDTLLQVSAETDQSAIARQAGDPLRAALWDFAANATLGALPKAVSGFAIVPAYPQVIYQGWVGGIVSRMRDGTSRFDDARATVYYVLTIVLQLTGYSMVVGAGVNGGLALLKPAIYYQGRKWIGLFPVESLKDFAWLYLAALPFFFIGSLWEFFSSWNL